MIRLLCTVLTTFLGLSVAQSPVAAGEYGFTRIADGGPLITRVATGPHFSDLSDPAIAAVISSTFPPWWLLPLTPQI